MGKQSAERAMDGRFMSVMNASVCERMAVHPASEWLFTQSRTSVTDDPETSHLVDVAEIGARHAGSATTSNFERSLR
jgi:hypothetical protein